MAKIRVAARFLAPALFPGAEVEIVGASFDPVGDCVLLEVSGPGVPDAEMVRALLRQTLGDPKPERLVSCDFEACH